MALHFHKTPIILSASTLKTLVSRYSEYSKAVSYPTVDEENYQRCRSTIALLQSSIKQLKEARENLQILYNEIREEYKNCKSKTDRKELMIEIEQIEEESQLQTAIAEANDLVYVITARVDECKNIRENMEMKLGYSVIRTQRDEGLDSSENNAAHIHNEDSEQNGLQNEGTPISSQPSVTDPNLEVPIRRTNRPIRPPQISLLKFYGDPEEFPEFWAMFETLVHNNHEIDEMEKILHLMECLKGRAHTAIKGIKLVPENYNWLIETLKETFCNQPTNRSQIVQKLINLKAAVNTAESCSSTFAKIRMLTNQMISAGYKVNSTCDPMWGETILSKFPQEIVRSVLIASRSHEKQTIDDLMGILKTEVAAKAYVENRLGHQTSNKVTQSKTKPINPRPSRDGVCVFCQRNNHTSIYCRTVSEPNLRRKVLREQNCCWKCFSPSHNSFDCQITDCGLCGQKHHVSLCYKKDEPRLNNTYDSRLRNTNTNQNNHRNDKNRNYDQRNNFKRDKHRTNPSTTQMIQETKTTVTDGGDSNRRNKQLILMTAEGNVWNENSQVFEKILFFFDSGAQKTVIQENLANRLGLKKHTTELCTMSGIGGHIECFPSHIVPVKLGTAYGEEIDITVQTTPKITNGFPSVKLDPSDIDFLKSNGICLANSKIRGEHQNPDVLVGLDYYHELVTDLAHASKTPSGFHIAKTIFGPTIYGRGMCKQLSSNAVTSHTLTAIHTPNEEELLQKMFELDGLGIVPDECQVEEKVQKYFEDYKNKISFDNNVITAPFPLKENVTNLEDNYTVAIKRLQSTQQQLQRNPHQKQWYCDIIQKYLTEGIIEKFQSPDPNAAGIYYMPHSGVWKPQKSVPLRIVFDASSSKKGQLSLNDVIHKGESFIKKIHDILISTRFKSIILMCDIEAAFTQIRLVNSHKDLCRFLWLKNVSHPPTRDNLVEFRFKRLPFGITASPSILNMAIVTYLSLQNSALAEEISNNLYVDNILLQAETIDEAVAKYTASKKLFLNIGMNLREYISNSQAVNNRIPESDRLPNSRIKFLGVNLDTEVDEFTIETKFPNKLPITKRDIVSQINSIFDPIGLAAPLIVKLKVTMRKIFNMNIDWKTPLPAKLGTEWIRLCKEVDLAKISIKRCLTAPHMEKRCLWVFCDASTEAIASCAYIQYPASNRISELISGKTKLTPKKCKQTIPRLELLGILIGVRLGNSIISAASAPITELNIVSDSEIALFWVKSTKKVPIFVSNQREKIVKIKTQLESHGISTNFFHVPTEHNPADAGTRGLTAAEIANHDWVNGPRWLQQHSDNWPIKSIESLTYHEDDETTAVITAAVENMSENTPREHFLDLTRFSKLETALRVVATVANVLQIWAAKTNNSKNTNIILENKYKFEFKSNITASDIAAAEQVLLASEHINIDLNTLRKRFRDKQIIRDSDGILRHFSRLQNAAIPEDTKSPIYVPEDSELARLIVLDIHNKNGHCGKEHTFSIARQRFWIPKPSKLYRKFIKNCVICKKYQGLPFGAPAMPPLPKDRVINSRPFENVGSDFMGPFTSRTLEKMYVCLYTCLTTRAVHLEVVENMSAGAFLNCFVRFISRRGVPKIVRTDCGTNFKLGQHIIEKTFAENDSSGQSLMSYCPNERITWLFNPPGAPWMGGAWERLVGLTKKAFYKSIGRKRLSFTEMCTVTCRIEAILNTRPLTKSNTSDLTEIPLRPIDFLRGNFRFSLPNNECIDTSADANYDPDLMQSERQAIEAYEASEAIANAFWGRWNTEYLSALRETQRSNLKQPRHLTRTIPVEGEVVLIEEDLLPRGCWSYGRVAEVIISKDGLIRTAKVALPNRKIIQRPLNRLFPLEIRSLPDENIPIERISEHNTPKSSKTRTATANNPPQNDRSHLTRASKTKAYEVIRDFEAGLTHQNVWSTSFPLLCLSILSVLSPATAFQTKNPSKLLCYNGKVHVPPQNTSFQLCINEKCIASTNSSHATSYAIPISPHNNNVKIEITTATNNGSQKFERYCARPNFCEHNYFLSKSLLGNPHCSPIAAIATLAVCLYILILIVVAIVHTTITIRKKVTNEIGPSPPTSMAPRNTTLHGFVPAPLPYGVVVLSLALALVGPAAACQGGYTRHSANVVCNDGSCNYHYSKELLFNRLINEFCIEIHHENKTIATVKVVKKSMTMTCSKVMETFTRKTRTHIYYVERCPEAGSCTPTRCQSIRPHETVSELRKYSGYPGYSGCTSTCGGLPCGCLLPLPACRFYRVANRPTSDAVYEVVRCAEWSPSIEIDVKVIWTNGEDSANLHMKPYIPQAFNRFNITAISVQKPTIPLMDQRFAIAHSEAYLLPAQFTIPVECANRKEARSEFHKCQNQVKCHCDGTAYCQCPEESLASLHNTSHVLPILTPSIMLKQVDEDIVALTNDGEFVISLDSKSLMNASQIIDQKECNIRLANLTGCYECEEGAKVTTFCYSQVKTQVTVNCKRHEFLVDCAPNNTTTVTLLPFQNALIAEECEVECAKSGLLKLHGLLHYHIPHKEDDEFTEHTLPVKNQWFTDWSIPDLTPLIHAIQNNWKLATVALTSALTLAAITYLAGPMAIVMLLKVIFYPAKLVITALCKAIRGNQQ